MTIDFASQKQIDEWDELIAKGPTGGNILQGKEFLEQKSDAGWTVRYILIDDRAVSVLEKNIRLLGKLWYCPLGPDVASVDDLASLIDVLLPFARKHGVFSLKIEPLLDHVVEISKLPMKKTTPVQYNTSTVLVDLSPSLDEIMGSLPQKGRHAIRRAERDGVCIKKVPVTEEYCRSMYNLLKETGDAAGFPVRPYGYYKSFYQRYGDNGGLFLAYFDDKPVAGAFAMVLGKKSMYKDGASVRDRPAYGASHLLQWHVIEWAKKKGSLTHDLAGAPPIAHAHDPAHPLYAIGKFKRQFNPEITEYVGAFNVAITPFRGMLWHRWLEKLVRKLYFMRHHESFY